MYEYRKKKPLTCKTLLLAIKWNPFKQRIAGVIYNNISNQLLVYHVIGLPASDTAYPSKATAIRAKNQLKM